MVKNSDIKVTLNTLSEWSWIAFNHEIDFLEMFAKGDAWTLTHVSWDEDNMRIVYVLGCGQHVTDSFKMSEWLRWLEKKSK